MSAPRCTTCADAPVAMARTADEHDPEAEADVARHFLGARLTATGPEYLYACGQGHRFTADFLSPAHDLGTDPVPALSVTSPHPPGPVGEVADIPEVPAPRA